MKLVARDRRVLHVDFTLYTGGDVTMKHEIIRLMIENLEELEESYHQSRERSDPAFLAKAFHKIKATIAMLNDPELTRAIESLFEPGDNEALGAYAKLRTEIASSLMAEMSADTITKN